MKVVLYTHGELEAKRIADLDMDHDPVVGDEISVFGVSDFVVRRRRWETSKISMQGDPIVHTCYVLIVYVQPVEAFRRELARVRSSEA
jgi:hypothetical protein